MMPVKRKSATYDWQDVIIDWEDDDAAEVKKDIQELLPTILSGAVSAFGLAVGGMVLPPKVVGLLSLDTIPTNTYYPTVATVMGGAMLVGFISYRFIIEGRSDILRRKSPFFAKTSILRRYG